jgi:hypothetical protein
VRRYTLDDQVIDVDPNERFEIAVTQPGATGYLWNPAPDAAITVLERRRSAPASENIGAGVEEIFVLSAGRTAHLRFALQAPWEEAPAETRDVLIRVR